MAFIYNLIDRVFYGIIEPLFSTLAKVLEVILIRPMELASFPVSLQVIIVAVLTALLSFALRRLLRVKVREKRFHDRFHKKRSRQDVVKEVEDWKAREVLLREMNKDLDSDYNTYLAQHFVRYMSIYMLPIFMMMAWLNKVLSNEVLTERLGSHTILPLNVGGMKGLSVTGVFLITYVVSLIAGFLIIRRLKPWKRARKNDTAFFDPKAG